MDECLPQEMLEAILGKLDRETLCTARLVSRTFCAAASANISSLTVRNPSRTVSLERFTRLRHVRVHHSLADYDLAQLDPRLRAVITHLGVSYPEHVGLTLPELPGMPKLQELDVGGHILVTGAAALQRLRSLEVLRMGCCTPSVATTLTKVNWLTSLAVRYVALPGQEYCSPPDSSWLQHATNLRQLQALDTPVPPEALPLIGNLTGLTGLTLHGYGAIEDTRSIAPLSRLSRLRSLDIEGGLSDSNLAIACSLGSGSLTKLHLCASFHVSADWGRRLFAGQTALKNLSVEPCEGLHMWALRVELLQCLTLGDLSVDAEGLDALLRATSLTKLRISTIQERPDARFSQTLGWLTQLRSLQLDLDASTRLDSKLAVAPLTALTDLRLSRVSPGKKIVPALLGLTGLQVLELQFCRLTNGVVPELGVLTNLRTLRLHYCGVRTLAPATTVINPLHQSRGWPPVEASCEN